MANGEPSGKKARVASPGANAPRVKQEGPEEAPQGQGGLEAGAASALLPPPAAAAGGGGDASTAVVLRFDKAALHCPICTLPLKPPIFQCGAGHMACGGCRSGHCHACGEGFVYIHNPALDMFARSGKTPCPYEAYGCGNHVPYYDVADHQRVCPHAPCSCSEPGCGFLGPPPTLLHHLRDDHSWPVMEISYRAVHPLPVTAAARRHLIVATGTEEDEWRVFVLGVGALGAATTVSLVCLRANGAAGPQYTCKMWTQSATKNTVMVEAKVSSSDVPREVAMEEEGVLLTVPPAMVPAATREMILRVRIEKTRPPPLSQPENSIAR